MAQFDKREQKACKSSAMFDNSRAKVIFSITASVSPPDSGRKAPLHVGNPYSSSPVCCAYSYFAFCQLHGFSYHDTQSHRFDFQICGNLYRISNEVSVMNKCLCRQFGIVSLDILFTLCTGIKDDTRASESSSPFSLIRNRSVCGLVIHGLSYTSGRLRMIISTPQIHRIFL